MWIKVDEISVNENSYDEELIVNINNPCPFKASVRNSLGLPCFAAILRFLAVVTPFFHVAVKITLVLTNTTWQTRNLHHFRMSIIPKPEVLPVSLHYLDPSLPGTERSNILRANNLRNKVKKKGKYRSCYQNNQKMGLNVPMRRNIHASCVIGVIREMHS